MAIPVDVRTLLNFHRMSLLSKEYARWEDLYDDRSEIARQIIEDRQEEILKEILQIKDTGGDLIN